MEKITTSRGFPDVVEKGSDLGFCIWDWGQHTMTTSYGLLNISTTMHLLKV